MKKVNTLTSWDNHFPCFRELIFDLGIKLSGELDISHSLGLRVIFNPLTPMSDQDRISPYNINTISTR